MPESGVRSVPLQVTMRGGKRGEEGRRERERECGRLERESGEREANSKHAILSDARSVGGRGRKGEEREGGRKGEEREGGRKREREWGGKLQDSERGGGVR